MQQNLFKLETMLELVLLRERQAQSELMGAKLKISHTQSRLDALRFRPSVGDFATDLAMAAALARWPEKRNGLLMPIQAEMAEDLVRLERSERNAARASASVEAIKRQLETERSMQRRNRENRQQERMIQDQLCTR